MEEIIRKTTISSMLLISKGLKGTNVNRTSPSSIGRPLAVTRPS